MLCSRESGAMAAVRPMQGTFDLDIGFRLGDWEVRPRQGTLVRGEIVNRLEPRVMAVLLCLARHAPDVVTREEFVRSVWHERVVTDEVLSRCISLLRAALDDQTREPQCILTLPRIGYRLVCPVGPLEPPPARAVVEVATPLRVASSCVRLVAPAERLACPPAPPPTASTAPMTSPDTPPSLVE
jgi:DNA-binding winged helix-turn-helix (wHTH) protein